MIAVLSKDCKFRTKSKPSCSGYHSKITEFQNQYLQELVYLQYRNGVLGYWANSSCWVDMNEDNSTWIES